MRWLIFILVIMQHVYGQDSSNLKTFVFPPLQSVFFNLEVLDCNYTLIPLNGGLFCPEKQSWYQIPKEMLFNGVSYYHPNNTMNYSVLKGRRSFIYRLTTDNTGKTQEESFQTPLAGLFFCQQLDADTLLYGGLEGEHFSVFTYAKKNSTKLIGFDGRVSAIQFINSHSFYFQVKNNIYLFIKGYQPKIIFSSKYTIYGFCLDQQGNLYISRKEGVFKYMKNSVKLVLPFVTGFLKLAGNTLYIISFQDNVMIKLNI